MDRRARIDALRAHPDPLVRVAVETLAKLAGPDFELFVSEEAAAAQRALEELVRTQERIDEAKRRHGEKVKAAYVEAVAARRGHFTQAWQWGYEYVTQDGTELAKLREEYGLTRDEVEALADGMLVVPQQEVLEDYPAVPDVEELEVYARIFSRPFPEGSTWIATERKPEPPAEWSPGGLLNYLLDRAGEPIIRDNEETHEAGREAAMKVYCAAMGTLEDVDLTEREGRDARRFVDEHRLRHPENRKLTLDGRPVPDFWDDDGLDHAARTASFVGAERGPMPSLGAIDTRERDPLGGTGNL